MSLQTKNALTRFPQLPNNHSARQKKALLQLTHHWSPLIFSSSPVPEFRTQYFAFQALPYKMASATVASVSSASSSEPVSPSSGDYLLSIKSYLKIIMHALRYPHATVNGVLIAEKKGKTNKQIRIVDAIPLFHSGHGLAPMTEVALTQISEYCSKSSDLVIGGYYQVNDTFHEFPHPNPTVFAERIADKIFEANSDAVLFMISNYGLAVSIDDITRLDSPFYMFQNTDGKWKLKNNSTNSKGFALEDESAILELTKELIFKKSHHLNIIDFDSHLENVKDDWRNPKLNEAIENFVNSN